MWKSSDAHYTIQEQFKQNNTENIMFFLSWMRLSTPTGSVIFITVSDSPGQSGGREVLTLIRAQVGPRAAGSLTREVTRRGRQERAWPLCNGRARGVEHAWPRVKLLVAGVRAHR